METAQPTNLGLESAKGSTKNKVIASIGGFLAIGGSISPSFAESSPTQDPVSITANTESLASAALVAKTKKKSGRIKKPAYFGPLPLSACHTGGSTFGTVDWQNCNEGNDYVYAILEGSDCAEFRDDRQIIQTFYESSNRYFMGPGYGENMKYIKSVQPDLYRQKKNSKKSYAYGYDVYLLNETDAPKTFNIGLYPLYGKAKKKVGKTPLVSEDLLISTFNNDSPSIVDEGTLPSASSYRISTRPDINSKYINDKVVGSPNYEIKPDMVNVDRYKNIKAYLLKVTVRNPEEPNSAAKTLMQSSLPGSKSDLCYVGKNREFRP